MELEQSKLYDILIGCIKKNKREPEVTAVSALSAQDWRNLLALAGMQRITPLLWHRLKEKGLDKVIPDAALVILREASRRNTLRNIRLSGELRLLLSALKAENIPLIPLKGIVLANTVYENISLREMNDIDVLARPADLTRIADILMNMGYKPSHSIDVDVTMKAGHHLPCLIKKGHAGFEVHWNLTNPGERFHVDPHGLWERAVPVKMIGCDTLIFSPEDMLLHLCVHASYHHRFTFGLRPFCDIAGVIDHWAPDWLIVADRACDQGWQRGVYLVLRLAAELAGAAVPAEIMERLQPMDMSENILETTRAQVFTDKSFAVSIPTPFAKLLESKRLSDKIKIFWQRVFLPRATIAGAYSIPENSPMIYFYYLRRFFDVLRRHGNTLKYYKTNDSAVKSLARRTKLIADWMD